MSRQIFLGGKAGVKKIMIGGGTQIPVQSMWKESIAAASETELQDCAEKLCKLSMLGLDIMRFAVPDAESAEALKKLSLLTNIPLVADIHFDYRLAVQCMEGGAIAAIRINPGNIGDVKKVTTVVEAARNAAVPLRIGVNSGSLPKDLAGLETAEALVKAAEREMEVFERLNFTNYAVSLKASDLETTVAANQRFAQKYDIPLHLGVTEAGPAISGAIKSAVAFYRLLHEGIGDTIRVSLSDSCELEVLAGVEILKACGKIHGGVKLISCPRCGRNGFDVHSFVQRWQSRLYTLNKNVTIAVMGCAVNGPGEAKNADIGISGGKDFAVIFKNGKIVNNITLKNCSEDEKKKKVDEAFEHELKTL